MWNEYNPKEAIKTGEIWPTRYQDYFIQLYWYIDIDRMEQNLQLRHYDPLMFGKFLRERGG